MPMHNTNWARMGVLQTKIKRVSLFCESCLVVGMGLAGNRRGCHADVQAAVGAEA